VFNKVHPYDPQSGHGLTIGPEGEAYVVVHPHPPKNEEETSLPYRSRFSDSAGSTAMAVNGSITNVEFSLRAISERDIYVNSISVRIADGGSPNLNKFGNLTALTNGVEWKWTTSDNGVIVLHEGIQTNLEFIRTGHKTAAIGTGTDAYLADVSGNNTSKAYLPIIDISEQFGKPWGMRLRKGTNDKITFVVKDDLTGLDAFDAIAYGVQF
jgi:hypothetical protein